MATTERERVKVITFLRVEEGVFRRLTNKAFDAFWFRNGKLEVDTTAGHIDVVEVRLRVRGRELLGSPTAIPSRIGVLPDGRRDPISADVALRHAV